ncbi:hypothetical protein AX289_30140 [Methylorubrum populi]|nr:hypothetical protein AX289_30140 [Methylorubrum populi]
MRADYHPLRLRRILPAAGHLLDLEAAAAARGTERPDAGTRERFVRAVGRLLGEFEGAPAWTECSLRSECLGLSRALQWARAGSRIFVVPSGGLEGMPAPGEMRIGGIALPAPVVYVAFFEPLPTPDPDLLIEGVYLGEGGGAASLLAGFADHVAATAVIVGRAGDRGSAAVLVRCAIPTRDPGLGVAVATDAFLSRPVGRESPDPTPGTHGDRPQWTAAIARAAEIALHGAALAAANPLTARRRRPAGTGEPETEGGDDGETCLAAVPEIVVEPRGRSEGLAEFLFGETPPRLRHRWPEAVSGEAFSVDAATTRSHRAEGIEGTGRSPVGHRRGPFDRVYHKGTERQFTRRIPAHDVNGGAGEAPREIRIDHLHERQGPAPGSH